MTPEPELWVDLGLPSGLLWATRNLDVKKGYRFADSPFEYDCSFFSWGNIDGHNPTSRDSFSPWDWGGVNAQEPYYDGQVYGNTPGASLSDNIPVNTQNDAARALLGGSARIPTSQDFSELFANVKFIDAEGVEISDAVEDKRVTVNGVLGIYLESRINGNRLFFACSGDGSGANRNYIANVGLYWSSSYSSQRNASHINFSASGVSLDTESARYFGMPIRPVKSGAA